jgi:hypothetical protein
MLKPTGGMNLVQLVLVERRMENIPGNASLASIEAATLHFLSTSAHQVSVLSIGCIQLLNPIRHGLGEEDTTADLEDIVQDSLKPLTPGWLRLRTWIRCSNWRSAQ